MVHTVAMEINGFFLLWVGFFPGYIDARDYYGLVLGAQGHTGIFHSPTKRTERKKTKQVY